METLFFDDIKKLIGSCGTGPLWVHSGLSRVTKAIRPTADRQEFLNRHLDTLTSAADGRNIWFPAFNYGFPRSRTFDVPSAASEVGALSEHARTRWASWRTAVPVFSACGRGERPEIAESGTIDPFGDDSIFARLIGADGALVFYGAPFHSITLIHHVERLSGGPVYRYDKTFAGTVTDGVNAPREIVLNYHVRPMGRALDYDWPRLTADLTEAGVLREVRDEASVVLVMPAAALTRFWLSAMKTDPLYLLDAQSRSWAAPMFERLGRRFRLEDFE